MSLPTEASPSRSVGDEDGSPWGGTAVLVTPIEWMRFCSACESEQRFVADQECDYGLVGRCANCREERFVPFTRTTGRSS